MWPTPGKSESNRDFLVPLNCVSTPLVKLCAADAAAQGAISGAGASELVNDLSPESDIKICLISYCMAGNSTVGFYGG
jgi:hypothetical protein